MYCAIDGRRVTVRETSGRLVRQFSMNANVIGAQVNGEEVIIQCEGGWTHVYRTSGGFIRKTKN